MSFGLAFEMDTSALEAGLDALERLLPRWAGTVLFGFIHGAEARAHLECPKDTLNLNRHIASQVDPGGREATLRTHGVPYAACVHVITHDGLHVYQNPTTPGTKPWFIFDPMLYESNTWDKHVEAGWRTVFGGLAGGPMI